MKSSFRIANQRHPISLGFTLIELLIVISIASFLIASLGMVLANYLENAKEAQTVATLQKIDGLINQRLKGLERAYRRPDFATFVNRFQAALSSGFLIVDQNGNGFRDPGDEFLQLPGFSREATEMLARKAFARMLFPQYFSEAIPFASQTVLQRMRSDRSFWGEDANGNGVLDPGEDLDGDTVLDGVNITKHQPITESSELLYYALTQLEVFGIPPIGDDFKSSELRDTDGDGLLEFVDGWGRPLRFYRSPTRLIKPYGALGPDGVPGNPGDDNPEDLNGNGILDQGEDSNYNGILDSTPDDFTEVGIVTSAGPTDDLRIDPEWRRFAGLFVRGLPRAPVQVNQPSLVIYDQLNQDPDDPYGLLLSELRRLSGTVAGITPQNLVRTELGIHALWSFPTFDVYHKPLVVSAGPDGLLGILEPFPTEDFNGNGMLDTGEDLNSNGVIDLFGNLACPEMVAPPTFPPTPTTSIVILPTAFDAAYDNVTNRNRRAGGR